jgi:hypothetical protein
MPGQSASEVCPVAPCPSRLPERMDKRMDNSHDGHNPRSWPISPPGSD